MQSEMEKNGTIDMNDLDSSFDMTLPGIVLDESVDAEDLLCIPTQGLLSPLITPSSENRFANPVSESDLQKCKNAAIPEKTRQNDRWALSIWCEWARYRNSLMESMVDPKYPVNDDLTKINDDDLNYWLQQFIVEIRRRDKTPYPPDTLMQISSALQRTLRRYRENSGFSLFQDTQFQGFRDALDARMKFLRAEGIGVKRQPSDPVTRVDEETLWNSGVFNLDTAQGLLNAVFFYNGCAFGFRGMEEHKTIVAEQYEVGTDENGKRFIRYYARITKNVQGGLKQRKLEPRVITHLQQEDNPRCLVKLYERYLSLIPRKGPFYRKPLAETKSERYQYPRFGATCLPAYKMANMFKELYKAADINTDGRKISNHSGRVACGTRLYNSGFTDKAVMSRTGHRSNAVHTYQREQTPILQEISNALAPPRPKTECETETISGKTEKCEVFKLDRKDGIVSSSVKPESTTTNELCIYVPSCYACVKLHLPNGHVVKVGI